MRVATIRIALIKTGLFLKYDSAEKRPESTMNRGKMINQ